MRRTHLGFRLSLLFLDLIRERFDCLRIAIEGNDPRLGRLLEEDLPSSLPLTGELRYTSFRPHRVFLDRADETSEVPVIGDWVKIFARNSKALERLLPAIEGFTEIRVAGAASWILERLTREWEILWVSRRPHKPVAPSAGSTAAMKSRNNTCVSRLKTIPTSQFSKGSGRWPGRWYTGMGR